MKISIGSDHRGFALKKFIKEYFLQHCKDHFGEGFSLEWIDVGVNNGDRSHYPVYAKKVCYSILEKKADFGILICGSGVGMSMAANRYKKIYAALCWKPELAKAARHDDGTNILVLSSDYISKENSIKIVKTMIEEWRSSKPLEEIYQKRLDMMDSDM